MQLKRHFGPKLSVTRAAAYRRTFSCRECDNYQVCQHGRDSLLFIFRCLPKSAVTNVENYVYLLNERGEEGTLHKIKKIVPPAPRKKTSAVRGTT